MYIKFTGRPAEFHKPFKRIPRIAFPLYVFYYMNGQPTQTHREVIRMFSFRFIFIKAIRLDFSSNCRLLDFIYVDDF